MKARRNVFAACIYLVVVAALPCQEKTGASEQVKLTATATTKGELKLSGLYSISFPVLQGSSFLTDGNNIKLSMGAELSPVSANAIAEIRLTPIAFLQFFAGASAGTGWNIPIADGLRKNNPAEDHEQELVGDAFDGVVWMVKGGSLFQFDTAAIVPGEWNHVVFQTTHVLWYRSLTSASSKESWLYEADQGENRNGWNYYANYFVGYKMPIKLNLAGILLEQELNMYTEADRDLWGDDLSRWTVGAMANYAITDRLSLATLVQWRTVRNFTEDTRDYGFYQDRRIQDSDQRSFEFYRAVLTATWLIR